MIFTVPDDLKGSFVLGTLKRALSGGMSVSIDGDNLYAPDIKMAIKRGILIPAGDEYDEEKANTSHEVIVQNRTDRVLVLGELVLRPLQSLMVSRGIARSIAVLSAEKNGFVHIIYDNEKPAKKASKKKDTKKKSTKKKATRKKATKKKTVKKEVVEEEEFVPGAERQVTAKVWNFRDQESEDAKIVPKTPDIHYVTEEHEDIDFIDEPLEAQEVETKKKSKKKAVTKKKVKKASKKKATKKTIKKKGKATKKQKVKAIEPVGDVAIELDSNGRPLENASDALNHLIDSLTEPEDVSFVDGEQAQDRYENRTDMD